MLYETVILTCAILKRNVSNLIIATENIVFSRVKVINSITKHQVSLYVNSQTNIIICKHIKKKKTGIIGSLKNISSIQAKL